MKLYIMESKTGLVKVGVSKSPDTRLTKLENETGSSLSIVWLSEELQRLDAFAFEKHCFFALKKYHSFGEWYSVEAKEAIAIVEGALDNTIANKIIAPVYLDSIQIDAPYVGLLSSLSDIVKRGAYLATHNIS